jgi:hypothetical protein
MMTARIEKLPALKVSLIAAAIALAVNGMAATQHAQGSQDATTALLKAYRLEFENDWVRVVRAHYDAKAKLPEHEHPAGATVYLYLNASDGVVFQHDDGSAPLPRPPVQPGGIRLAVAPLEHHTMTNNADTPSDFIRILLKTQVPAKISRPHTRMTPTVMDYEHAMLRVSRINVEPGTKTRVEAKNYPVLRIAWVPGKSEWRIAAKDGYRFLDKATTEEFEVTGEVPMQLVTIELRTPTVVRR